MGSDNEKNSSEDSDDDLEYGNSSLSKKLLSHSKNRRNKDKEDEYLLSSLSPNSDPTHTTPLSTTTAATTKTVGAVSIRLLIIIILISLFSWFYLEALAGGDIEWVKDNLTMLGLNLVLSVLCLTLALTLIVLTPMSPRFRALLLVGTFLIVYALKRWDDGESFEAHGAYNMLIFLVIVVPLNGTIQLILFLKRSMTPKNFHRAMLITTVGTTIATTLLLTYYQSIWGHGSLGHRLRHGEQNGVRLCEWQGNNIPFIDLLPNHIQNFWAGSSKCDVVNGIEAKWSYDGILSIQCLNKEFAQHGQPTYDVLPDTRSFELEDKINGIYHRVINNRTVRYPYEEPVYIGVPGVEAIVANCEEGVSKLLVRVQRQEAVLERVDKVAKALEEQEALASNNLEDATSTTQEVPSVDPSGSNDQDHSNNRNSNSPADAYERRQKDERPNVLVLFMDAVSRRQVYRKMEKTTAMLASLDRSETESGGPQLFEFFRYHAVGFNTNANSRALYTDHADEMDPPATPIWKDFYEAGYVTNRVEDNCEDWSASYTRTTTSQYFDHELQAPFCMEPYFALEGNALGNFKGPYSIVRRCIHGQYVHQYALDYMTQFRKQYRDRPWFQMGSLIEGHEGTGEVLLTIDQDLANFFKGMEQDGTLDNTIVFFMADHGLHMGINFMFSGNGRIEHMNPYLSILLPPTLAKKYPTLAQGLLHNQQSLITAHEIYKSLKLFATPGLLPDVAAGNDASNDGDEAGNGQWRQGTLFDETLNPGRTCDEALIPEEYCKCR
ncbi:hypothetical protein BGW42_004048 [Actinomortierella wolfii]|nr:hypothetical protein BGW42_004048 [Actinomortierella wolfii]